ncbi:paxillin-like [Ptychodera flava]|uniref:paxillin-like n=1 Tax=Ptychodera flava TaxID=63121 RepID=UPI00396A8AB5
MTDKMSTCSKCDEKISGTVITALTKKWHPDCFKCNKCKENLRGKTFFKDKDGEPLCEDDYTEHEAARCENAKCKKPIVGEIVVALNRKWHRECFVCEKCKKQFKDGSFSVRDGKPYCREDYEKEFLGGKKKPKKCEGCGKKIKTKWVEALGQPWHCECFVCEKCKEQLFGEIEGSFNRKDDKPYCDKCIELINQA